MRQRNDEVDIDDEGRVLAVPVPRVPAHEVYPGLWLGGGAYRQLERFDAILTCCPEWEVHTEPAKHKATLRMSDGADLPDPAHVNDAVQWVLGHLNADRTVLVRCYAGLNRSGLITAHVLHRLTDLPGSKVLIALRAVRGEHVLCNPVFAAHIEGLRRD